MIKYHKGDIFTKFGECYIITSITDTEVEFLNQNANSSGYQRFTKMSKETFEACYERCFWDSTTRVLAEAIAECHINNIESLLW